MQTPFGHHRWLWALLLVGFASCRQVSAAPQPISPTPPGRDTAFVVTTPPPPIDQINLLRCTSVTPGAADRRPIDRHHGGYLAVGWGGRQQQLSVPPGSVERAIEGTLNSLPGEVSGITAYVGPERFAHLALLTLSYDGCEVADPTQLFIVQVVRQGGQLRPYDYPRPYAVPYVNTATRTVTVPVEHLSEWAIGTP